MNSLFDFDKDNIPDKVLRKINKYTSNPDFQPEKVGSVSFAAKSLCMWVRAMETYGQVYRVVQPKRERYNQAMALLKEKQDALADAKKKLEDVTFFETYSNSDGLYFVKNVYRFKNKSRS